MPASLTFGCLRGRLVLMRVAAHQQHVDLACIATQNLEYEIVDADLFATMRDAAETMRNQSAYRVDFIVAVVSAEDFVELLDFGKRTHAMTSIGGREDIAFLLVEIVFLLDVADNLLEHILDRDESGDAAVFIDDDGRCDCGSRGNRAAARSIVSIPEINTTGPQHAAYVELGSCA